MAAGIFYSLNALVLIGLATSFVFWTQRIIRRVLGGVPELVPRSDSGREPPWSVLDFLVMFGLMIVCFITLSSVFVQQGWIERTASLATESAAAAKTPTPNSMLGVLVANSLASILAMTITLIWIVVVNRIPLPRMGLAPTRADALLGIKATWWFLPPVLMLSLLVSLLVPYEHPVLESLAELSTPLFVALMFLGTAVVAPVTEEFMFRVLLQGGLQRIADRPHAALSESSIDGEVAPTTQVAADADNPYQPPLNVAELDQLRTWTPRAVWPILVTSVVFAIMHMGQGAAPIPLFFLSLALGYLYRQTGRITAPLLVHMALNSLTLAVEFSRLAAGIPSTTGL